MKKFILSLILFFFILLVVLTGCLLYIPHNPMHYIYAHKLKMERIDTLSTPRLIIAGGSNTAFGFDSRIIEDSLKLNVVNAGVQAGIGLRFLLDDISERVRRGDVIVIMPEYSQFYDLYNGIWEVLPAAVLYSGKENWKKLNSSQKLKFITGLPSFIAENINAQETEDWPISGRSFNEQGDETGHWKMDGRQLKQQFFQVENDFDQEMADDLAEKIKFFESKGCKVYILWPVTIKSNYDYNIKEIAEIERELNRRGLRFSSSADYLVFPDSIAFDTPYHLQYDGVKENTHRFIEWYRRAE